MPRVSLSAEQITEFRARAVQAAGRIVAKGGYDALTMRALAAELGCSAMTAYRYFEDRDELFAMVRAEAFRRFGARQQAAFKRGRDPVDRLSRLKRAYIQFAVDDPDSYRIMFELRQPTSHEPDKPHAPGSRRGSARQRRPATQRGATRQTTVDRYPTLTEQSRRSFSYIHQAAEQAVAEGILIGDPVSVAHILWAHLHGLVSLHLAGKLVMGRSLRQLSRISLADLFRCRVRSDARDRPRCAYSVVRRTGPGEG